MSFKPSIGRLTSKSDQNDPQAKPRTYKDTKTEQEVTVYELRYPSVSGKIVGIEVDTSGEYGSQVKLTIRDEDADYIVPIALNKSWGTKVAEAIPNINLDEEVLLTAFADFTAEDGKEVQAGLSIKQGGQRVYSKFKSYDTETKTWTYNENFPEVDRDKIPSETNKTKYTKFWNDYFYSVGEFLTDYLTKNYTIKAAPRVAVDATAVDPF